MKTWLLLCLFVCSAAGAADSPTKSRWEGSFLLGGLFSFAYGYPTKQGSTRNSLSVHVGLEREISAHWSFAPELTYAPRGAHALLPFLGATVDADLNLDYLELPILFKRRLSTGGFRTFVILGPSLGLAVARDVRVLGAINLNLSDRFSSFDLSFVAGYGFDYALRKVTVTGMIRLHSGILDVDTNSQSTYRNASIQFVLGTRFNWY